MRDHKCLTLRHLELDFRLDGISPLSEEVQKNKINKLVPDRQNVIVRIKMSLLEATKQRHTYLPDILIRMWEDNFHGQIIILVY